VLADPSPAYRKLRDAGPFVALPQCDIVVMTVVDETRDALLDREAFSSAQGVGFTDMINEAGVGTIIASDSPHHHELPAVGGRA
jgi:4-methoxybenzoate monooxygenase (O-demethylating)